MSTEIKTDYFQKPDQQVEDMLSNELDALSVVPKLERSEYHHPIPEDFEEDDEIKSLDDCDDDPRNMLLRDLEDMYDSMSHLDLNTVKKFFKSEKMKDTIKKLHSDFERDFVGIPKDDEVYIRVVEILAYIGIPVSKACHDDLESN